MPSFGVSTAKEVQLKKRMVSCGIHEADLDEHFIRSGGPGGQHVNTSATCVYLKHGATGLEVKMQESRSQALNRYYARKRLCELIEQRTLGERSTAEVRREKIRKQKSRRRRRNRSSRDGVGGDGSSNDSSSSDSSDFPG